MELKLDIVKGWLIAGKPITENDIILLLSHYTAKNKDKDLELVLDYWIMLKEPGHNGFWLKQYHADTQDKSKACRTEGDKGIE